MDGWVRLHVSLFLCENVQQQVLLLSGGWVGLAKVKLFICSNFCLRQCLDLTWIIMQL